MNKKYQEYQIRPSRTVLILLALVIAMSVSISVISGTKGSELSDIENKISKIEDENRELESQIINESSLTNLNKKVESLGLAKPSDVVYLKDQLELTKTLAKLP